MSAPFPDPATLSRHFGHVDCWIFDLDNTLYAPEMRLFAQIEARMTAYVQRLLGVDEVAGDQDQVGRGGPRIIGGRRHRMLMLAPEMNIRKLENSPH